MTCDICDNERRIRLPVRSRAVARYAAPDFTDLRLDDGYRTFDCPACVTGAADENVATLGVEVYVSERHPMPDEHVADIFGGILAREIVRQRRFVVEEIKSDRPDQRRYFAKIATVSPKLIMTIEQRAIEKLPALVSAVAEAAAHEISIWGSAFGRTVILKSEAIGFMYDGFRKKLKDMGTYL